MDIIIPKQNHFFDKFYRFPHFPNSYYYVNIYPENKIFSERSNDYENFVL